MADSCSNLKRSRTELLASMSNPTCSGRLVSAWKLRICSGGLLSSTTRKSACFRSVMRRPFLSVTVKTTLTSSVPVLIVGIGRVGRLLIGRGRFCPWLRRRVCRSGRILSAKGHCAESNERDYGEPCHQDKFRPQGAHGYRHYSRPAQPGFMRHPCRRFFPKLPGTLVVRPE